MKVERPLKSHDAVGLTRVAFLMVYIEGISVVFCFSPQQKGHSLRRTKDMKFHK